MSEFETVIGLEVHAQLKTATKIFCGCSTTFTNLPNTNVCPVCMGLPGALPVLNRRSVEFGLRAALALHCQIQSPNIFSRKNYFYPDLPKGYQISQFDEPLAKTGWVEISSSEGVQRKIGITRIHLEDDAGKNIHDETGGGGESLVDFNRCGIPLIEIVSEPEIRSPQEAVAYLKELRSTLRYIGVCDGNMEEGSFRCDANISLRAKKATEFGTKVELKNMNSFRHVERAVEFEASRQHGLLTTGQPIDQETRLWDASKQITLTMRSKEEAHDYRYFPEPDLLPLIVDPKWIDEVQNELPELPAQKRVRFQSQYALSPYDTEVLTSARPLADYFEETCCHTSNPKPVANWICTEVLREVGDPETGLSDFPLTPKHLATLLELIHAGEISGKIAKTVFKAVLESGDDPRKIVQAKGLVQISDPSVLEPIIDGLIQTHAKEAQSIRDGNTKAMAFFVGGVMKSTQGKANPQLVTKLLNKKFSTESN